MGIPRSSCLCGTAVSKISRARSRAQTLAVVLVSVIGQLFAAGAMQYSEICYAGPRYRARLDPITGVVVPVFENFTEIDVDGIDDDFPWNEYPFNSDPFVSQAYPPEGSNNKNTDSPEDIGIHRSLRSDGFWRRNNLDEDSETDAIVVKNEAAKNSVFRNPENIGYAYPTVAAPYSGRFSEEDRRYQRFLQDGSVGNGEDDLEEGKFYVRPCLCSTTRWTFPNENGSSSTNETNVTAGIPINRFNVPHNFGRHSNGKHVYVPDNREDSDLHLCHARAVFCAVPVPDESNGGEGATSSGTIVRCYDETTGPVVVRNLWPFVWVLYWGLIVCCCCTFRGRVALDFVRHHLTRWCTKVLCCCLRRSPDDHNERMLRRMIDDEEHTRGQNADGGNENNNNEDNGNGDGNGDEENESRRHPSCCSNRRLKFERKVYAQIRRPTGEETTFQAWLACFGFKSKN